MKKTGAVLIIFQAFYLSAFTQETWKNFSIPGIVQYDFTSRVNHFPYRLTVALPFGYSPGDTTHYPVLYILDADPNLPLAALIQWNMTYDGELPNMILVGIGYQAPNFMGTVGYRTMDYTPTKDKRADSEMTAHHHVEMVSGGAANFLRVITEEVMPLIQKNYKVSADPGLAGHSFGGLFAAYVLVSKPETFGHYLISSPSLSWDGGAIKSEETKYFSAGHRALPAKVFVSAGASEPDSMVPDLREFAATLTRRNYAGLKITQKIFDGETHLSVIPFSFSRGLRALYHN
jgi:predicted alpha/beta superfamily hydrolase